MKRLWTTALLALCAVAIATVADAQSADERKLAALADAWKSGVLTRQEYDAKVAQVKGASADLRKKAALDDARKAGILTQQEYDAKLQALKAGASPLPARPAATSAPAPAAAVTAAPASSPSPAPAVKSAPASSPKRAAAVKSAPASSPSPSPVVRAAPTSSPAPAAAVTAAPTSSPSPAAAVRSAPTSSPTPAPSATAKSASSQKRTVSVADPLFGMPGYTVTIPSDWSFEGAMLPGSCGNDLPVIAFRAYSPDKLTGVQMLPRVDWYSAQDPRAVQMSGISPCNFHRPAHAADVAPSIAAGVRRGSRIGAMAPLPPALAAPFKKEIDANSAFIQAASAATPGYSGGVSGDQQRVRVDYDFEGHPEEEWLNVSLTVWDSPVTVINTGANRIIQPGVAHLMHTEVIVTGIRAPVGKLDAAEKSLVEILQSVKVVPLYEQTYMDFMQRKFDNVMASIRQKGAEALARGARDGAALKRQSDQYHAFQQENQEKNRAAFERDMRRKDGASKDFLDYVSNQTYYLDPVHGATVTIQNQAGVNGYVTQNSWGNWTELVPIHH